MLSAATRMSDTMAKSKKPAKSFVDAPQASLQRGMQGIPGSDSQEGKGLHGVQLHCSSWGQTRQGKALSPGAQWPGPGTQERARDKGVASSTASNS